MSNLSRFLKQNKITKENEKFAPTASLLGEDGKPLEWEFKHITSKQNEELRENCTIDVQIKGKPNMFRQKLKTSQYLAEMIVASTVVPNLYNKELQESYEVKTPVELLYALVDDPGEFTELEAWVQKFNGFDQTIEDKVEEAKN
ncbi:MAG: hypothetical protein HDT30_11220 [Clostridiales bacterium]|nr:hypothetical protein [Clostridiales bacterium]